MEKVNFVRNNDTGLYYSKRTGRRLSGGAEDQARVKDQYGGIKNLEQGAYAALCLAEAEHERAEAKAEECRHWKEIALACLPNFALKNKK